MKKLILLALFLSGCGLESGFNNPLFWDLLLINSTFHAQNEQNQPIKVSSSKDSLQDSPISTN